MDSKIGSVVKNNQGCEAVIIEKCKLRKSYYLLEFIDEYAYKIEVHVANIKRGAFKNLYHKNVCDIGFLGDKYNTTHFLSSRWSSMLNRCYNSKGSRDYINYGAKGVTVCDRWHNFSNYVDDVILLKNYNEDLVKLGKLHLDKDIINRNAKVYSPDTCGWVTQTENTKEMNRRTKQQICIATRLSDNYSEEFYNITDFCNLYGIKSSTSISDCLKGRRNDYAGWKFKYKESPATYKYKVKVTNSSGYMGVCRTSDKNKWRATAFANNKQTSLGHYDDIKDAIIARYNWEVENHGIYRKPDSKDDYLKEIGYIK